MGRLLERITQAEERLKQLKAEQQRIEARRRSTEQQHRRQDETRRRILVGAVVLARVEAGLCPEAELQAWLDAALTRPQDRRLFDLPLREEIPAPETEAPAE